MLTAYVCNKKIMYVCQALLRHGANIEAQQEDQWTGLMFASHNGHLGVVEVSYSL